MKSIFTFLFSLITIICFSQTIGITSFATGFTSPLEITHPVNDARLFVVQQTGAIKILNPNGTTNATNFLTLTGATISTGGERGLLGLAFHPNYATNGFFYVDYTNTAGNTVIARYSVSADPNVANAASGTVLLTIAQPFSNHNGGTVKFGPDGYLYIGMGDGGSGNDPGNRAQNITENLGKMLRIDVDSASPYGIPPTNPYVGIAGNDEIWAIGVRNPWKYSFNRLTGDMWIADVGQSAVEEIDKVTAPLPAGLNFGWRCYEGTTATVNNTAGCPTVAAVTMPFAQYTHAATGGCSITGGYVYTGTIYPNFLNKYFFADYCLNRIGYVNTTTAAITYTPTLPGSNSFTTFGEDMNGELYIGAINNGIIYKIIDTSLAVNTFTRGNFSIYPNPASSEVFISSAAMTYPAAVSITDLSGKLLSKQTLNAQNAAINTAGLSNGIYMISIKDQSGADYSTKLSIKKKS